MMPVPSRLMTSPFGMMSILYRLMMIPFGLMSVPHGLMMNPCDISGVSNFGSGCLVSEISNKDGSTRFLVEENKLMDR